VDQTTASESNGTIALFSARGLDAEIMLTIVPPSLLSIQHSEDRERWKAQRK
jgi:hypothetical protein